MQMHYDIIWKLPMGVQTVKCRNPKNKWGSVLLWTPLTFIDGQKKVLFFYSNESHTGSEQHGK